MNLLSSFSYSNSLSDVWGYATDEGEYALVGLYDGISILDVTNATSPNEIGYFVGPSSIWRDLKTYGDYVYCINETGGGLQILNIAEVISGASNPTYLENTSLGFTTAHNIYVDEQGYLFVFGSNYSNGGAMIFDLNSNPENPSFLGNYSGSYFHDGMVRGDTLWGGAIYNGQFSVVDVSNPSNPILMATQSTPNNFTHNCWISEDGNTVFTTDEVSGAFVTAYDVSDLNNIEELDRIQAWSDDTDVIPHNTHVAGDFLVTSYYRDGVSVVDVSHPSNLIEVGYYDTSTDYSGSGFNGAWGTYPFLPSGNILVSDIENGLYIIEPKYSNASLVEGTVSNALTGGPISNVTVQLTGSNDPAITALNGFYETGMANEGIYTITFSATGYVSQTLTVELNASSIFVLDVELTPSGCMEPEACNFNPFAVVDDGSCAELDECGDCGGTGPIPGYDCSGNCISGETLTIQMMDSYGDGWNGNTIVVNQLVFGFNTGYDAIETLCYDPTVGCIDVVCDGGTWQSEVTWTISNELGNILLSGGAPFVGAFGDGDCAPGYGCMDANALNFDETAEVDDGSCLYPEPGCMDENACNYNPYAAADDGSCEEWDECGVCGGDGPEAGFDCDGSCLSGQTLVVQMMDSYGDGWNGNTLSIDGILVTLETGFEETTSVCYDDSQNCVDVVCNDGSWQSEVSWVISETSGTELLTGGAPYSGSLCATNETVCQSINFTAGWSMFSTYILSENMLLTELLAPLDNFNNLIIVKNIEGASYLPDWDFNGIGDVDFKQGYLVKVNNSQSLEFCGLQMNPEINPIVLNQGWNMFSYLRTVPADTEAVFSDIQDYVILVKNNLGEAYLPEWDFNGIGDLESGKGYVVKMSEIQSLNYLSNTLEY